MNFLHPKARNKIKNIVINLKKIPDIILANQMGE